MMSPSSALANRSFLYGGGGGGGGGGGSGSARQSSCLVSEKIVYATLDSLALKRATLPLRLVPVESSATDAKNEKNTTPGSFETTRLKAKSALASSPGTLKKQNSIKRATRPNTLDIDVIKVTSYNTGKNGENAAHLQPFDSESDNNNKNSGSSSSIYGSVEPKSSKASKSKKENDPGTKKEKREFTFAKNVLHYVPMTSRRYYRKSRKLACKSLSLKSLGEKSSPNRSDNEIGSNRTLKSRSLSRDELKYLTISAPSNFVHVASATRSSLMPDSSGEGTPDGSDQKSQSKHIITHEGKYADLRGAEYAEIVIGKQQLDIVVNDSFLWRRLSKVVPNIESNCQKYDDDDYDDVGPPVAQSTMLENSNDNPQESYVDDQEQDAYDDVGPAVVTSSPDSPNGSESPNYEDRVYDDVMPLRSTYEDAPLARNNGANSEPLDSRNMLEEQPDEDVYDDVGLPTTQSVQDCHERVNSLYAGSSASGSIRLASNCDKESEWEDLDDAALYGISWSAKQGSESCHSTSTSPSKKKLSGQQRWSRKVRRQRSRASRKSSSSRTRTRPGANENVNHVYLDSSDDSNYETLETYELDDFSSDSESESFVGTPSNNVAAQLPHQEPPNRPIPPPPREASLGYTLGRRMKILRRTWSITKGSLGRMRRRASGECEPPESSASNAGDARKYFSFKKHFRKSQTTGLSTFYLDKAANAEKESQKKEEPIYSNSNWYREAGLYANEVILKTDEAAVDHYSVLAEEPLYQFYAAAATRVAFESDSDGYEEVEELTPSAATTDLVKPGHRTLWCQTPQVINSSLLQRLTMEERKIQEAKFEILTSEASYLNSLRVLENEFASNYELSHEILTSAEREKLFGAVPDVLVASERFLAELEANWREDPMLGRLSELLLKHGERSCNVYVDYCSNQVSIDTTLKELKAKKGYKFLETVSRIEMHPACQSLSLHSFLMLPMQRITRLPLLADAVLSKLSVEHSERLNWEGVLATLSQVVAKCNEGARLAERRNEMEALARKLEYSAKVTPIDLRDRELIRSGTVIQLSTKSDTEYKLTFGKKFHKTPLMLMLLTDYLLVTKLKSNSNDEVYNVIDTCKRSMVALESAPEDSPFAGRHAMILTLLENHAGRQVEYVLTCENDTEKERWLDAVSPPKPTCVGETLYESWDCPQVMALYSYAPRQPDELALQPGDVINVLRKMSDGWLFGEKLLDGEQGWFPGNFTKEVASEHVRARNLRQRHRFLALSGSVLQRKAKQSLSLF